jgi:predicted O-linked N-acetylglucosamine transferase (SPINDLY family)
MPILTIQQAFELALEHHRAGRLPEAERVYRQILNQQPRHIEAIHFLGVIAHQVGKNDAAAELIRQAIALNPSYAIAYTNLGLVLKDSGKLGEAIACCQQSIRLDPSSPEAHGNLGHCLVAAGKAREAEAAFRQAIALNPGLADAWYNLGNALYDQARLDDAIAAFGKVITLAPDHGDAHDNLGNALRRRGRIDEALAAYRSALLLKPRDAGTFNNLAGALNQMGRLDEAIAAARQAIAHRPDYAEAYNNLGGALRDRGQLDEAIAALHRAIELRADYAEAHSNLIFVKLYHPACEAQSIAEEHRQWNRQHAQPLRPPTDSPPRGAGDPNRRLRIGYVSPDFRDHAVCRFALPLVAAHDRSRFEIFCYAQVWAPDATTQQVQRHADGWQNIAGMSDADVAQRIRADQIDILIDLAGHTDGNRLLVFARKPAPVQVTYLGYPATTGLDAIDCRLTDELADPRGVTDSYCSEALIRLPNSAWCYQPPDFSPAVSDLPALQNGYITFGSFNNFSKINPPLLKRWADILHRVPRSRLMLKAMSLRCESVGKYVREMMKDLGIGPDRLDLHGWVSAADHLRLYSHVDIGLDTYPYHGTTTTCEALWMGVPVVTLAGQSHVSRVGVSLLTNVALGHLVAQTADEMVGLAVGLANDVPGLQKLRRTLRQQMQQSPLMDAPALARNVETAYLHMWRNRCMATSAIS